MLCCGEGFCLIKVVLQVTHHFSHVHHQYHCWYVECGGAEACNKVQLLSAWLSGGGSVKAGGKVRWTDRSDLCESAVPASVNKVYIYNYERELEDSRGCMFLCINYCHRS